jgi:hypothetical protein
MFSLDDGISRVIPIAPMATNSGRRSSHPTQSDGTPLPNRRPSWSFTAALGLGTNTPPPSVNALSPRLPLSARTINSSDGRGSPANVKSTSSATGGFRSENGPRTAAHPIPISSPALSPHRPSRSTSGQTMITSAGFSAAFPKCGYEHFHISYNCRPRLLYDVGAESTESFGTTWCGSSFSSSSSKVTLVPKLQMGDLGRFMQGNGDRDSQYSTVGVFEIFDGFTDNHASKYFQSNFHPVLVPQFSRGHDFASFISDSCLAFDKTYLDICGLHHLHSGTCALGIYIRQKTLIVVNVGSSMAVLSSGNEVIELNKQHIPDETLEYNRIVKNNGWITKECCVTYERIRRLRKLDLSTYSGLQQACKYMIAPSDVAWTARFLGTLHVSRGFGEFIGCW